MKLEPYNAETYAKAWFRRMYDEAMANPDYVEAQVVALYVQLVQLSNAAAGVIGNCIPPDGLPLGGGAGASSLSLLKAELKRTDAVLKTDELEKDAA